MVGRSFTFFVCQFLDHQARHGWEPEGNLLDALFVRVRKRLAFGRGCDPVRTNWLFYERALSTNGSSFYYPSLLTHARLGSSPPPSSVVLGSPGLGMIYLRRGSKYSTRASPSSPDPPQVCPGRPLGT